MAINYAVSPMVLHRSAVTAIDASDPTTATGLIAGMPAAVPTYPQYGRVQFGITLTGTGTCTASVQIMFWNATLALWTGGAVLPQLTTATALVASAASPVQYACPCEVTIANEGRQTYLKVLAITGTSATLSATAVSVG